MLSRSGFSAPGVIVAKDWQEAALVEPSKTLFLAGGAALYAEALPWCAELIHSSVQFEHNRSNISSLSDGRARGGPRRYGGGGGDATAL